ncbi:MAG: OB-fold domain-containing protein [Acidimicrobiia bacterium]|nr:OB-fold domain-containing protein [Acidimicrobiia bacterium]
MPKERVPAIEGWFSMGGEPALVGTRGKESGSYFFPPDLAVSRDPSAVGEEYENVELSRTGTVWSYTTNHYEPPAPYVAPDPFEPYTVVAVELAREKMVVLGQYEGDAVADGLAVGDEVELVLGTLSADDTAEYVVWKWRKVSA